VGRAVATGWFATPAQASPNDLKAHAKREPHSAPHRQYGPRLSVYSRPRVKVREPSHPSQTQLFNLIERALFAVILESSNPTLLAFA